MGHPSSAPHSHAVFDSATAAALGGSCRRQPRQAHCTGAAPAARLWAGRTITYHNIEAGCSADQQAYTSVSSTGHMKAVDTINGIQTVEKAITWHPDCRIAITWHPDMLNQHRHVESAVRAPRERVRTIHRESTYFMHFLQCLDASHELEGVMTRVVSTDITVEGTLLNQDTRSMVQQTKVGITRSVVDGALVLGYEDMFTGKRSKLSRSQCLCPGRIEVPEARRFSNVLTPQIGPIGCLEGASVMSTSSPLIGFLRSSTSGHAVVELTSSRIDSPPRRVGNRKSSYDNDGADVVLFRAEGISVDDLKRVGSRPFFLESTEVLMHIMTISEGTLQSESNRFCSHKARSRVNNDRFEDLVSAADLASMCSLKVIVDRCEVLEERDVEVVLIGVRLHRQKPVIEGVRVERVARRGVGFLDLLPFIGKDIPSKLDHSTPMLSIFVSHEVCRGTQASNQFGGIHEREKIGILLIR